MTGSFAVSRAPPWRPGQYRRGASGLAGMEGLGPTGGTPSPDPPAGLEPTRGAGEGPKQPTAGKLSPKLSPLRRNKGFILVFKSNDFFFFFKKNEKMPFSNERLNFAGKLIFRDKEVPACSHFLFPGKKKIFFFLI